jgi:hypothetical protein
MYPPRSDRRNTKRGGFAFPQISSPPMFGHTRNAPSLGALGYDAGIGRALRMATRERRMTAPKAGEHIELSLDEREPLGEAPADEASVLRERILITRPGALPGVELWSAHRSSRKWSVHHETYAFCGVNRYERSPSHSWLYRRRSYSMGPASVPPGRYVKRVPSARRSNSSGRVFAHMMWRRWSASATKRR